MHVSTEVLVLLAIAVLLLVGVILTQLRAERRLKSLLRDKDNPVMPVVVVPSGSPDPGPHACVWERKHSAARAQWRIHRCTVPGCNQTLCQTGNARPPR